VVARLLLIWRHSALFLAVALLGYLHSSSAAAMNCADVDQIDVPGFPFDVTAAVSVPASVSNGINTPAHCRVEGEMERRTGADGKSYAIRFALALPTEWNGRLLFQGGGGLNGVLREPTGDRFAGDAGALTRGFAVVSNDSGHQAERPFDPSFFADQEALLNFLYRANERVARMAKGVVASYYAKSDFNAYFVGCSTGGREAMIMSQRYPDIFNGIVAGAPAMRTNYSELGGLWSAVHLRTTNESGGSGDPRLSPAQREAVLEGVIAACDAQDGIADRMIFDIEGCAFDPTELVCDSGEHCITMDDADAIRTAFAGAKDSRGYEIYSPYPFDTGIDAGNPEKRELPGLLKAASPPLSVSKLAKPVDWDAEAHAAADFPLAFGNTSEFEQINGFSGRGGKLIFYHGVSDPWFSAFDTVRYYRNLAAANGGVDSLSSWSRLFLNPGVGHCAGGAMALDQVDLLTAIVDWVESDRAPASIEASGPAFPDRTRPLCPYPQFAHYAEGDAEKAEAFVCK